MSFVARNRPQQTALRGPILDVDDRRTPPDLLAEARCLTAAPRFDVDVAATADNTVTGFFLVDGLAEDWWGNVWCNPPFSDVRRWVERAWSQWTSGNLHVDSITMLLPANLTEQGWWQDLIEPYRDREIAVHFLRGRRRFDRPRWEKPAKGDRPPFGICIVGWVR